MGKKTRRGDAPKGKGRKKVRETFTLFGETFDTVDKRTVRHHVLYLILISLATKLIVLFSTTAVFHSFVDLYDIGFRFQIAMQLLQGKIPYLDFSLDYPPLIFIPIVIALIPALATQSGLVFVYSFQLLMVLCDIGVLLCVYFIGLKVWNEKVAWYAGLIYATAFSASYWVLTRWDPFPTLLFMGAVLFTIYRMKIRGYVSATAGFFAKIFPAVAFPFMIFYNAKTTSLREEIISTVKVVLPFFLVLLLPFLILNPASVVHTYLFATGSGLGVYANSATYTLYLFLHEILHLGISPDGVSFFMYGMMGIVVLLLLSLAYAEREAHPITFLKILLCAVFSVVFFTRFHSPQYSLWFTPLLCLLVADQPGKTLIFYLTQVLGYVEFPLLFGGFYVNNEYVNPVGSAGWYITLVFFSLEYLALLVLVFLVLWPKEGIGKRMRGILSRG
jgi:hypothetical protein